VRASEDAARIEIGDVTLESVSRSAWRAGQQLSLTIAEFVLLKRSSATAAGSRVSLPPAVRRRGGSETRGARAVRHSCAHVKPVGISSKDNL
jgi:DNA-binding response OmpR family regulator